MSEVEVQVKSKKEPTQYTAVVMEDGTTVEFAGARKVSKEVTVDVEKGVAKVSLNFRNGAVRHLSSTHLEKEVLLRLIGHGLSQKIGDTFAGVVELDDMVLASEEMIAQLKKGDWGIVREAGDSVAGASVVIRAIAEVTKKPIAEVKAFLDKKLDAAKVSGQKLSRQALYASFRAPNTKTGVVIKRMEEDKATKSSAVNSDDLLGELSAD